MNSDTNGTITPFVDTVDSYVILRNSAGTILTQDDNGNTNGNNTQNGNTTNIRNARIPASTGFYTLPADGDYFIEATAAAAGDTGIYSLTLVDGGISPCNVVPLNFVSQTNTISGTLNTQSCLSRNEGQAPNGQFYRDRYAITVPAGQTYNVSFSMTSTSPNFDPYLLLRRDTGVQFPGSTITNVPNPAGGFFYTIENNDGGGGLNARIPATSGTIALPGGGVYYIETTTAQSDQTGSYTLGFNIDIGTSIPVSLPNPVAVNSGSTFPVPITIGAVPGNTIFSFDFLLGYDPLVLTPTITTAIPQGIGQPGTASAGFTCDTRIVTPGQFRVGCQGTTAITGSAASQVLINVFFNATNNNGTSSVLRFVPFNPPTPGSPFGFFFNEGIPAVFTFPGNATVNQNRFTGNVYYGVPRTTGSTPVTTPIPDPTRPVQNTLLTAIGNPFVTGVTNLRGAYTLNGLGSGAYTVTPTKVGDVPLPGAAPLPGQPFPIATDDAALVLAADIGRITLIPNTFRAADVTENAGVTAFDAAQIARYFVGGAGNPGPESKAGQWRFVAAGTPAVLGTTPSRTYASITGNLDGQNYDAILLGDVNGNWVPPTSTIGGGDPPAPGGTPTPTPTPTGGGLVGANATTVALPSFAGVKGDVIEIPVMVSDLTARDTESFGFDVKYDSKVLKASAIPTIKDGTLSSGYQVLASEVEPGRLRVGGYGIDALKGSGALIKLKFDVIGNEGSNTAVKWDFFYFRTTDSPDSVVTTNGSFTVNKLKHVGSDFDGDGISDLSVFRSGNWYVQRSRDGFSATQFGYATDQLASADYDGDGKTDIAVLRDGNWYIMGSRDGFKSVTFGQKDDIAVPADYDGDGKADIAVFRKGYWYIINSSTNAFRAEQFGIATDKPVVGDYDGDGKADIAVTRANGGVMSWYLMESRDGFKGENFGANTDKAVAADYDGDGKTDIAVFRAGTWYVSGSQSGFKATVFGQDGDAPTPGDYDGDGKSDIAVFRAGTWYYLKSGSNNAFVATQFGDTNDTAIPNTSVR